MSEALIKYVQEAEFLPPSFHLIPRLLLVLDDPELDSAALAEVIRVDPGLTADVLRISNSASFARGERIYTLYEAVMRLGVREVYRIVMKVIASPVLGDPVRGVRHETVDLWEHSLAAACAAQVVACAVGEDPEVAFTASLLHDAGKVLLYQALGPDYAALIDSARQNHRALWAAEREKFQMSHAEAGGLLLQRWNFPEAIHAAVAFHHEPLACRSYPRAAACACAANIVAHRICGQPAYRDYVRYPDPSVLESLGLTVPGLAAFEPQVRAVFEKERESFR